MATRDGGKERKLKTYDKEEELNKELDKGGKNEKDISSTIPQTFLETANRKKHNTHFIV